MLPALSRGKCMFRARTASRATRGGEPARDLPQIVVAGRLPLVADQRETTGAGPVQRLPGIQRLGHLLGGRLRRFARGEKLEEERLRHEGDVVENVGAVAD